MAVVDSRLSASFSAAAAHGDAGKLFDAQAEAYAAHRPSYPQGVRELLATNAIHGPEATLADIATGSGQMLDAIGGGFGSVIGLDSSDGQLEAGRKKYGSKVRMVKGNAEQTNLDTGSVDVATVGQALHWFDREAFYAEMQRVLKPATGLLCIVGYSTPVILNSAQCSDLVFEFHDNVVGDHWDARRGLVERWLTGMEPEAVEEPRTTPGGEFRPTFDWSAPPEGEPLPAGLHFRLDMETGKQMARLSDPRPLLAEAGRLRLPPGFSRVWRVPELPRSLQEGISDAEGDTPRSGWPRPLDYMQDVSLKDFIGYVSSWSGYNSLLRSAGIERGGEGDPLLELEGAMQAVVGSPADQTDEEAAAASQAAETAMSEAAAARDIAAFDAARRLPCRAGHVRVLYPMFAVLARRNGAQWPAEAEAAAAAGE